MTVLIGTRDSRPHEAGIRDSGLGEAGTGDLGLGTRRSVASLTLRRFPRADVNAWAMKVESDRFSRVPSPESRVPAPSGAKA